MDQTTPSNTSAFGGLPEGFARMTVFIILSLVVGLGALYSMYVEANGGLQIQVPQWFLDNIYKPYSVYYIGFRSLDTVKNIWTAFKGGGNLIG